MITYCHTHRRIYAIYMGEYSYLYTEKYICLIYMDIYNITGFYTVLKVLKFLTANLRIYIYMIEKFIFNKR